MSSDAALSRLRSHFGPNLDKETLEAVLAVLAKLHFFLFPSLLSFFDETSHLLPVNQL